jgi:hypothetical protein
MVLVLLLQESPVDAAIQRERAALAGSLSRQQQPAQQQQQQQHWPQSVRKAVKHSMFGYRWQKAL